MDEPSGKIQACAIAAGPPTEVHVFPKYSSVESRCTFTANCKTTATKGLKKKENCATSFLDHTKKIAHNIPLIKCLFFGK